MAYVYSLENYRAERNAPREIANFPEEEVYTGHTQLPYLSIDLDIYKGKGKRFLWSTSGPLNEIHDLSRTGIEDMLIKMIKIELREGIDESRIGNENRDLITRIHRAILLDSGSR